MPLKEADLKDVETYKKALRADLSKLSSGVKYWIYKDIELLNAQGKKQKYPAFLVFVEINGISHFLMGKKLVVKGMAEMEQGKIAFHSESAPIPYKILKTAVPAFTGKLLYIPPTADAEAEGGEGVEDESEAPSTSQDDGAEALSAAWGKLLKEAQVFAGAHPERRDAIKNAAEAIGALVKSNHGDEARHKMAELEALLKAPVTSAKPVPPELIAAWQKLLKEAQAQAATHPDRRDALKSACEAINNLIKGNQADEAQRKMTELEKSLQAATGGSPGPDKTELTAHWNSLLKQMQAAVAAHPEMKAEFQRAGAGIPDLLKADKLDQAKKQMDGVEAVLKSGAPSAESPQKKLFDQRFAELDKRTQEILKQGIGDASRMRAAIGFASEKAVAGDFGTALKALDSLQTLLTQAAAEAKSGPGASPEGLLKYRKALLDFESAKNTVATRIGALAQAMTAKYPDNPDLTVVVEEKLAELNEEIGDSIDAALSDAEGDETPETASVESMIQKYLKELASNPLVKRVDTNPLNVKTDIAKTLSGALSAIHEAIPA